MVRLMICLSVLLLGSGADLLSARGRELVAGSYNIRCDTPVDGDNAWPYRKERVEALIRFYGFDVLGVQEAKPSQMSDLRAMPGFASVGVGRDGGDRGEYSAIFYRTDPSPGYSTAARSGSPRRPIPSPKGGMRP